MRHRVKRIRWPALLAAAILAAGSGTAYAVTSEGTAGSYRTARAAKGDVEEVLSTSGAVDAARRADLEFATSGTVASVEVALGDAVKAGQVIARLDTDALEAAVTRAEASVARAVARLEADESAQEETVADATSTSRTTKPHSDPSASASPGAGTDPGTEAALADLEVQQRAVVDAQSAETTALAAARDALAAQTEACADAFQEQPASTDPTAAQAEDAAAGDAACSAALAEVQARQATAGEAQDALARALSTLAATLAEALATLSVPDAGTDTPATPDTPATSNLPTQPEAPSGAASAAQLASDQAAIEQARAELVEARQQLRAAVVRSTRAGKVVSLDLRVGDEVAAGEVAAVIVGGTSVTVEAAVGESDFARVAVGQRVRVTTPGGSGSADGVVTAVGLVADSSSGTASYSVTVTVDSPAIELPAGSEAMLGIVVATAEDVVTVPTSAITRRGDGAVVQTRDGDTLSRTPVTIGSVGAREVEITAGLAVGDEVVLADLDEEITGASDSINDRGGFGNVPDFRIEGAVPGGGPPVSFGSGP